MIHFKARHAYFASLLLAGFCRTAFAQELPPLPELPALPDAAGSSTRTAPATVSSKQSVTDHAARTTAMPSVPEVQAPAVAPMPAGNLNAENAVKAPELPPLPPLPTISSLGENTSADTGSSAPKPTTVTTVVSPNLPSAPDVGASEVDAWLHNAPKTTDPIPTNSADPTSISPSVLPNAGMAASASASKPNAASGKATATKANAAASSIFSNIDLPNGPQPVVTASGSNARIENPGPSAMANASGAANLSSSAAPEMYDVPATIPNTAASTKNNASSTSPDEDSPAKAKPKKAAKKAPTKKAPFYAFQYKSQFMPEAIYKPSYSAQNKHLPKSQTEADYDRFMFLAAAQNNVAGLRALLATQGRNTEILDGTGQTPLLVAVRYGAADAVRLLLASGANVDAQDKAGVSTLHYAVLTRSPDLVRTLLQARANPAARDPWNQTPLDLANYVQDETIVRLMQDQQFTVSARSN